MSLDDLCLSTRRIGHMYLFQIFACGAVVYHREVSHWQQRAAYIERAYAMRRAQDAVYVGRAKTPDHVRQAISRRTP